MLDLPITSKYLLFLKKKVKKLFISCLAGPIHLVFKMSKILNILCSLRYVMYSFLREITMYCPETMWISYPPFPLHILEKLPEEPFSRSLSLWKNGRKERCFGQFGRKRKRVHDFSCLWGGGVEGGLAHSSQGHTLCYYCFINQTPWLYIAYTCRGRRRGQL